MLRPAGGGQRRKARKELGGSEEDVTYVASSLSLSLYSSHPLPTQPEETSPRRPTPVV